VVWIRYTKDINATQPFIIKIRAAKQLIASKIKVCVYIIYVCV